MNARYRLVQKKYCGGIFYAVDKRTGSRESLKTKDRDAAVQILDAKNQAERQPAINVQIARAYLAATDSLITTRTWQEVMEEMAKLKKGSTLERWKYAVADKAFDVIRSRPVLETNAQQFLRVLELGTVATNVFLRRMHNFTLDMGWLAWPILPRKQWPPVQYGDKRAITVEEHERILQAERNPEWNQFYQLCWHLGGSQTDVARLRAQDIDWQNRLIAFSRVKSGTPVMFSFGERLKELLKALPSDGFLFPRLADLHEKHRAKHFNRRCKLLGIAGISLHSYRYGWAERAREAGYPERFAQEALGHSSRAVHRAYARRAHVKVPSLEEFEKRQTDVASDLQHASR